MRIEIVPCLSDNYAYLMNEGEHCAVLDPSEAAPVQAALDRLGWRPQYILNTHHHNDHVGGNLELKRAYGAQVVGPGKDKARIPGLDIGVDEQSGWSFAGRPVPILEVPGHTRGAITFVFGDDAFTGDTLFALGCGRLFEGDPPMMWTSLSKLMALPDATRIYCGHEYTENNGRFALTVEPDNTRLAARMVEVKAARAQKRPTIPSTLGLEKQTNPFLRPGSAEIRQTLRMEKDSDVAVFAEIRRRKDNF
ncbi:MAG TPA: hydroxyacylglutathione hydrolase [Rhizomicrobium sp.]|nr:hydroxyacylglutathione hydrolase [Rhizomicrobium sp.]